MLVNLLSYAKQYNDDELISECNRRLETNSYPKITKYEAEGAADPNNRPAQEKRIQYVPNDLHPGYGYIKKGGDPFRNAQIQMLHTRLTARREGKEHGYAETDLRALINIFSEGRTRSTVTWWGSLRELHFILKGWGAYLGIKNIWEQSWQLFIKPKSHPHGQLFTSDELRKSRDPELITQDLVDIVETLNPENIGEGYQEYVDREEKRIGFKKEKTLKGHAIFEAEKNDT